MFHYNYYSSEIYHYYSSYCKCAITISHFLQTYHYLPFQCVYKNIRTKIPSTFFFLSSLLSLLPLSLSMVFGSPMADRLLALVEGVPLSPCWSRSPPPSLSRTPPRCRAVPGRQPAAAPLASDGGMDAEAMERDMQARADGMTLVLETADALRVEMMRGVVALLRRTQVVHFLLAAAELHLVVHEFGCHKDGRAGDAVAVVTHGS